MGNASSKRPTTLRDVASASGVHFSTVSLVLSGSQKVAARTRERVLLAAKKLNYRRDPVLHALSVRRSRLRNFQTPPVIMFLTNRATQADFEAGPHMTAFLAGAQSQARAMGFACECVLTGDPTTDISGLDEKFAARNVRGVILAAFMPQLRQLDLDWSRYAVVKIDSWYMPPAFSRISHNQLQAVRLAFQALQRQGYRRIGMAVGQIDEESSDELYLTAYLLEQHLGGKFRAPPLHFDHADSQAACARKLGRWAREHQLDAVISNWGNIRELLTLARLDVPHDLACANLCLYKPHPFYAGTVMPHAMVGQKAVETIALLIKNQEFGIPSSPTCLYVSSEWHDGPSAPPRSSPARPRARR